MSCMTGFVCKRGMVDQLQISKAHVIFSAAPFTNRKEHKD